MSERVPTYSMSIHELRTDDALCIHTDDHEQFHVDQEVKHAKITAEAVRLCKAGGPGGSSCPIIYDCFRYGYLNHLSGVYGGSTTNERKQLRKLRGEW
jgi:hypothetical protein